MSSWEERLVAACRKIAIARFHAHCLSELLFRSDPNSEATPIPIQAHFEGVLYAAIAASDQVAEAVRLALDARRDERRRELFANIPRLAEWDDQAIVRDVRDIRRLAAHHRYTKVSAGFVYPNRRVDGWVVQDPTGVRPYGGRRDLLGYVESIVDALNNFEVEIIPAVQEFLDGVMREGGGSR